MRLIAVGVPAVAGVSASISTECAISITPKASAPIIRAVTMRRQKPISRVSPFAIVSENACLRMLCMLDTLPDGKAYAYELLNLQKWHNALFALCHAELTGR